MRQEEIVKNLNVGSRNGMLRRKRRLELPLDIHSILCWESYPGSLLADCWTFLGALLVSGTFVSLKRPKADGSCLAESQSFSLSHLCEERMLYMPLVLRQGQTAWQNSTHPNLYGCVCMHLFQIQDTSESSYLLLSFDCAEFLSLPESFSDK